MDEAADRRGATGDAPPKAATERGGDPTLDRFWEAVRRLPRYVALGVHLARDDRVPRKAKRSVLLGGAYAVSPIDLVPGIIPVAGQLDDLAVLLLALRRAIRACPAPLAAEHLARAGVTEADFERDLATCRATARWLAAKGLRLGRRLAGAAGRRIWATVESRSRMG